MSRLQIASGKCWGLIPARGGSKSIPLKNLHDFAGRPLIDYVIAAGEESTLLEKTWCSTDHDSIADHAQKKGIGLHMRPDDLAGDMAPVIDTMTHFLKERQKEGPVAEFLALLQPTSPFTRPEDIDECIKALRNDPAANSAQTVIECPHNHHAVNQRKIESGYISFLDQEARKRAYNKQKKQKHYLFGNIVVTRCKALLEQQDVFALPGLPIPIDSVYGFDADNEFDFSIGTFLIKNNHVTLNHLHV